MVSLTFRTSVILLITALILIQGAAALTIEQAPLNPAFVAYMEGLDSGETDQFSIECYGDSCPVTATDRMPYATGDIPAPIVMVWPDTDTIDVCRIDGAGEETFPARFDLRDDERVTPVRDQGDCGSCWAFAAYGSLESTYLTDTGTAENFSENNMKNLCSDLYPDGYDRDSCDGGNAYMSAAYLTRGSGPVLETDDPYALPVPSTISPIDLPPVLDTHEISFLPTRTDPLENSLLKQTLVDEGALRVRFLVNRSCFSDNISTYYHPDEGYPTVGGHAVTLVGWDDDFPKERFAVTPPGDGAFLLKNSWSTDSGEDGYFHISYYDRTFDTGEPVLFTGVPADCDRHIYQYDPLGWASSYGTGTDTTYYGANVFTAESYESLTDVSFYTREPGTEYTVAVFTSFTTPPGDVAPVTWTSGTADLPGYHTISLPDSVSLMPGETFSVVLEVSSPTNTHPLAIEKPIEGYSSGATAEAGESYVSDDGKTWTDLTTEVENANVCIKAFTQPLTVVPQDYATIQEAVDAAASGDTIVVEAGTYPEELVLNKTVTLLGVGTPVVATPEDGIGVESEADNITIRGFTFDGNGAARGGIGILGYNTTIYDISVTGYEDGMYISQIEGLSLSTTALYDNERNLEYRDYLENPGNTIDETVTVNGRPVIYREGVSGESIDAASNAGAIICVNATDITIRDTTTKTVYDGITLFGCKDVLMENVTADDVYYGVWAFTSENITLQDSSFGPDMTHGMYAMDSNGIVVADNAFVYQNSGAGVYLTVVDTASITNNTMSGDISGIGIWNRESANIVLTNNTISEGTGYGIGTRDSDTITVTDNTMNSTRYGIMTSDVQTATISGNTIYSNDQALGLEIEAYDAEITGNTVDNSFIQAFMHLNHSVVRDNSFSGAIYPLLMVPESGDDVYLYRNDFILTAVDEIPGADILAIHEDTGRQEISPGTRDYEMWDDDYLSDAYTDFGYDGDASGTMAERTMMSAQDTDTGEDIQNQPVWNSPTEETYWYNGQRCSGYIGNYWSTYTGNDTTMNGIGDVPFTIYRDQNDTFPLVKPGAWYLDENPDSGRDDPSADIATSPALSAGDSATLSFTGTAVQTVTITAADGTGIILLTVDQARSGPDGLPGPVYQYISGHLSGMTDDDIKKASFSFRVPAAWLNAEELLPVDIALWRFHDGVWQELPTSITSEDGGWIHYTATTPGFSTFAIAEGDRQKVAIPTEPSVSIGDTGTETTEENVPVISEPQVTVVIPETELTANPTEETTTPQESPVGFITIMGGAAGAALLFRKQK